MRAVAYDIAEDLKYRTRDPNAYEPLLVTLMIGVIENFSVWRELRRTRQATNLRIPDFRLRHALRFMREHLDEPVSMGRVARACGLSRPHFFELFTQAIGITPFLYYTALRMEAAYKALPDEDISLGQLAAQIGFSASSHFTRFFIQNLGIPPSQYRRLLRLRSAAGSGRLQASVQVTVPAPGLETMPWRELR